MQVQLLHRSRREDRRTGGAGQKEEQEVQEEWEEQEDQEEWDEQEETTKGKRAPADQGKKLRTGRLIFRKEGTKGFIERLALRSDVVNSKD